MFRPHLLCLRSGRSRSRRTRYQRGASLAEPLLSPERHWRSWRHQTTAWPERRLAWPVTAAAGGPRAVSGGAQPGGAGPTGEGVARQHADPRRGPAGSGERHPRTDSGRGLAAPSLLGAGNTRTLGLCRPCTKSHLRMHKVSS